MAKKVAVQKGKLKANMPTMDMMLPKAIGTADAKERKARRSGQMLKGKSKY